MQLDLSRNSLTRLGISDAAWLPSLIQIQAASNRIGQEPADFLPDFAVSTPFLSELDLRRNLIPDVHHLKTLRRCQCLDRVDVLENPLLASSTEDFNFLKSMPEITTVDREDKNMFTNPKFCVLKAIVSSFANLLAHEDAEYDSGHIVGISSAYLSEVQAEGKRHLHAVEKKFYRQKSAHEDFKTTGYPTVFTMHANHLKKMRDIAARFRYLNF